MPLESPMMPPHSSQLHCRPVLVVVCLSCHCSSAANLLVRGRLPDFSSTPQTVGWENTASKVSRHIFSWVLGTVRCCASFTSYTLFQVNVDLFPACVQLAGPVGILLLEPESLWSFKNATDGSAFSVLSSWTTFSLMSKVQVQVDGINR